MASQAPVKISRPFPFLLQATWADGFSATISLESFRRACPCATCTGETIGDKVFSRPKPVKAEPGAFDLVDLKPIGNYAIAAKWANGHDTGIYTWEKFREIFEQNTLGEKEVQDLAEKNKDSGKKIMLNVIK